MNRYDKNMKKVAAAAILMIFFLVMSYFSVYEGVHMLHECSGEACPICHELHIAENFTRQITDATFSIAGCFILTVFIKSIGTVISCSVSERNLIIDKVRLDD